MIHLTKEFYKSLRQTQLLLKGFKVTIGSWDKNTMPANQLITFTESVANPVAFYNTENGLKLIYESPDDPHKLLNDYKAMIFYYEDSEGNLLRAFFMSGINNVVLGLNTLVISNLSIPNMIPMDLPEDMPETIINAIEFTIADNAESKGIQGLWDDGLIPNRNSMYGFLVMKLSDSITADERELKNKIIIKL